MSVGSGITLTLIMLLSITLAGPVLTNMTGTIKDAALTYVSFIFFEDALATPTVLIGLAISFIGAIVYIVAVFR